MLPKTVSAIAVAGLLIVVTGASAPNATASNADSVSLLSCCIKHAHCCKLQRECCPNRTSQTSDGIINAGDTVAAVSRPTCCAKRAYCCSINARCCGKSSAADDQSIAAVGSDQVAKPTCCMKRAYCCSVKRYCCPDGSNSHAIA